MSLPLITAIIRGALGIVFLVAAMSKITDPQEFLSAVTAYQLPLSLEAMAWIATSVPWFEFALAGLLLTNTWPETTPLTVACVCLVFAVLTGQAWLRGLSIDCGCVNLSFLKPWLDERTLVSLSSPAFATGRNVLLALLALCLYWKQPAEHSALEGG